jgi:GTPase SAR1 family protein
METIEEFKRQQERTAEILKQLLDFLCEGEKYEISIDPKFKLKLETAIKETVNDKLKVALIGGFSEGKTSIAAAWLEKYDKDTMKISQQESSNERVVYSMNDFDLIDTPGLFGFKETAAKEKYKDITKKYISEAHLVLYVLNPNNPIKESHREDVLWLFRDLNLLSRTIFVLSRFDEEVDIEDDDDYRKGLEIKRQNIIGRLNDFGIAAGEDVSIVAVSANPFGKGLDYWLSCPDKLKKLSHIELLQKATTEKIKKAGSASALVEASKKSIITDILRRELPVAIERDEKTAVECERLSQTCKDVEYELQKTRASLSGTRIELREYITELFTDLILQARGLDMETIVNFFERNIGNEGIVLDSRIQNEFERRLGSAYREINKMQVSIESGVVQYKSVIGKMALDGLKAGTEFLKSGVQITAEGVKAARNFIMPAFKFKPWGAVNLASKATKAMPIIGAVLGIVIEVGESIAEGVQEANFKKCIDEMVSSFEQQRKEHLELLNDDEKFIRDFFPNYLNLQKEMEELNADLQKKEARHEKFKRWRERGEAIEAEFKVV